MKHLRMKWYKIKFPNIVVFNEEAQNIRDWVSMIDDRFSGKNGIAMYRSTLKSSQNNNIDIEPFTVYFPESGKKLLKDILDKYNAIKCNQPNKNAIFQFYVPELNDPFLDY